MSKKKKAETPWSKQVKANRLYDKAVSKPHRLIEKALAVHRARCERVDNEVVRVVESLLKDGFVDCKLSHEGELVVEVSPRNLDPLYQARRLMRATGATKLCFLINHEIREVQK